MARDSVVIMRRLCEMGAGGEWGVFIATVLLLHFCGGFSRICLA